MDRCCICGKPLTLGETVTYGNLCFICSDYPQANMIGIYPNHKDFDIVDPIEKIIKNNTLKPDRV